jgi:hypothetical protein
MLLGAAGSSGALLLLAGSVIGAGDGAPQRFRPEALRYLEAKTDQGLRPEVRLEEVRDGHLFELGEGEPAGDVELLVWGDSHAMTTLHVVKLLCQEHHLRCVAATHSATAPLLGMPGQGPYSLREGAYEYARRLVDFVARQRVRKVLLAAHWPDYYELRPERFRNAVAETVRELTGAGAEVYVLKDVPFPGYDVPTALAVSASRARGTAGVGVMRAEDDAYSGSVNVIFDALAGPRLHVLDPLPLFTLGGDRYRVEKDGHALYFDHHHLSTHGALQLRPLLERVVNGAGSVAQAQPSRIRAARRMAGTF